MRVYSSESMPRALKREAVSELTCHDKENKGEEESEIDRRREREKERERRSDKMARGDLGLRALHQSE